MFVVLTYFLYSAPPAPLSVSGHNPVHKLVMDVQHQLDSLRANLGKNMQQVQVHIPTLHALQDSLTQLADVLHHRVDNLVHTLRDDVAASASAIKEGLGALQGGVSGSLHTISDGMHALQDNLHQQLEQLVHGGATGRLATSLPRVVQWPAPRWPVYVYMAGTMICLLASSICHLLGCCSQHVSQVVWRFDYAGIASLIVTSFYPPVYYFFMCRPWLLIGYMGSISLMGETQMDHNTHQLTD